MSDFKVEVGQRWEFYNPETCRYIGLVKEIVARGNNICEVKLNIEKIFFQKNCFLYDGIFLISKGSKRWRLLEDTDYKDNNILACRKCGTINEWAESNQPDGSYICYNCRS